MADTDILQVIAEARVDARSLSEFVFKPANFIVSRRLAPSINTLQYYIDRANSVNNAFSKSVSDATAAADIAISAANTASRNAIGLIDNVTNQASQSVQNAIAGVAIDANLVTDALTTIVPITTSATARTQLDKNRENVSILDFFTDAELAAFEADKTTFDAYRPIQEFFTYIAQNDVNTARADINAYIGTGITMGIAGKNATKLVIGNMNLTAMNAIDTMIMRELGSEFHWVGTIELTGHRTATSPPYVWKNRTCRIGMGTHPTYLNSRQVWDKLRFHHFQEDGLQVTGASSSSYYHHIRNGACGTYSGSDSRYRFDTTFSNRVDTGRDNNGDQRSTITVAEMPPLTVLEVGRRPCFILVDRELYLVRDYSMTDSTLSIYPWIDMTIQSGTLSYVFGAAVSVFGKDASGVNFGTIDGSVNGIGLQDSALYACSVGNLMCQASGIGFAIGSEPSAANQGGYIGSYYSEGNRADVMFLSTSAPNRVINSSHTLTASGIHTISSRAASTNTTTGSIGNSVVRAGSNTYSYAKPANNARTIQIVNLHKRELNGMVYNDNVQQFNMPDINLDANRLTGHDSLVFRVLGTGIDSIPIRVEFRQESGASATTNGTSADVVFSNFAEPPVFTVFGEIESNNYKVILNTRVAISTSVTLTSLESGESNTYPVIFNGVKTTDFLVARTSKPLQGTTIEVSVTSEGNALITHTNNTGLTVDIGAVVIDIKSI